MDLEQGGDLALECGRGGHNKPTEKDKAIGIFGRGPVMSPPEEEEFQIFIPRRADQVLLLSMTVCVQVTKL